MPNRIIKESICTSDTIDQLSWLEEVFFYRLLVNCDDYGRFDARTSILKSRLFPLKPGITEKNVADLLNKLSTVGLIQRYVVDQRPYLQLVTWNQHQQIRAKKSKYPAHDANGNQMKSDDSKCPRNPIQSESNPNLNQNPNPNAREALGSCSDEEIRKHFEGLGMEPMAINWAIVYSTRTGAYNVRSVLEDWLKRGIKTEAQARAELERRALGDGDT